MSSYIYDLCFGDFKGNRSQYAEELLLKGLNVENDQMSLNIQKIANANKIIREKDDEIHKLKFENNKLKAIIDEKRRSKYTKEDIELARKIQMTKAVRDSGMLRDMI